MFLHYLKDKSGVAAVEFALIAPILLTLLIGTIDIGLYLNDKMKLESVARSSAEYLITTRDLDNVVADVVTPYYVDDAGPAIVTDAEFLCECEGGVAVECALGICSDEGDYKRRFYDVTLTRTHNTLFVYPGFPATIDLVGTARMQLD